MAQKGNAEFNHSFKRHVIHDRVLHAGSWQNHGERYCLFLRRKELRQESLAKGIPVQRSAQDILADQAPADSSKVPGNLLAYFCADN